MKVTVSSLGRFHAFDLARQLQKRGCLDTFFTGYPHWMVDSDLREKTKTFPWLFAPQMAAARYGFPIADRLNHPATSTFDYWVARHLPECDIFAFLSQYGLFSLRQAKKHGIKSICIRLSAHIIEQDNLLKEEYEIQGVRFEGIKSWAIDKELQEYEESDLIEVCSTFTYQTFIKHGISAEKVYVSPLAADLSIFHQMPKQDEIFRVIYVGAMSLRKGISYLLEAMIDLNLPNFELVLIGSKLDETTPIFRKYEGDFHYLGVIPRQELYKYYSQCSVFVLPSIEDGFGMVMAQAMACGLPIIATMNTGARDLFTDNVEGFIVPIRSPEAIREKLLQLYQDPDLRNNMAAAALKRIQLQGGWDAYGQRSIQKYQSLLG